MDGQIKINLKYGMMALAAAFLWGLSSIFIKIVLDSFSPLYAMSLRFSVASLCFLIFFHKRIRDNLADIKWLPCLLIGLCLAVMNITVNYSLNLTGATTATFFFSIPAIFTPFVGLLLFRYRFQISHLFIVALVIVGLYMLCNTEQGFSFGWGEFMGAVSSVAFAFGMVLQNRYLPDMDDITVAAIQTVIIAVCGWLIAFPLEGVMSFADVGVAAWLIVAYLGIFGAFITAICQNIAINNMNADFVSVIFTAEPVFTAIIAYFVLGETLTPIAVAGAVIITIGVIIVTLRGSK